MKLKYVPAGKRAGDAGVARVVNTEPGSHAHKLPVAKFLTAEMIATILAEECSCSVEFDVHATPDAGVSIWATFVLNDETVGHFDLILNLKENYAYLEDIELNKGLVPSNLFKRTMANIITLGLVLEFNSLQAYATNVGAYAFARAGAVPKQDDWFRMRKEAARRLELIRDEISKEQYDHITSLLRSDDPKTIWQIVDLR